MGYRFAGGADGARLPAADRRRRTCFRKSTWRSRVSTNDTATTRGRASLHGITSCSSQYYRCLVALARNLRRIRDQERMQLARGTGQRTSLDAEMCSAFVDPVRTRFAATGAGTAIRGCAAWPAGTLSRNLGTANVKRWKDGTIAAAGCFAKSKGKAPNPSARWFKILPDESNESSGS